MYKSQEKMPDLIYNVAKCRQFVACESFILFYEALICFLKFWVIENKRKTRSSIFLPLPPNHWSITNQAMIKIHAHTPDVEVSFDTPFCRHRRGSQKDHQQKQRREVFLGERMNTFKSIKNYFR